MPTSFSFNVDTVEVPLAMPLRRARTVPDEGHVADLRPADIYAGLTSPEGRPYEYPAPVYDALQVRNTFVSFAPGRDPSLDGFFEERRTHSCPASWQPGEDEEDPQSAQPTRETTACGSASEGSAAASTPPLELSDTEEMSELIPTEDMSEVIPRVGANARAAALPTSSTTFRKTVSEYRCSEDSQQPNLQQVAMQAPALTFDMVDGRLMQRQPLQPGPIVTMQTPSNVQRECYYQDSYNAAFLGYDASYEGVYDPSQGYDNSYSSGFVDNYDGGYTAGYQPGISYALVPDYAIGAGQEAISMHSDPRLAGPSQVVLQLSSSVYPGMQPPPPPGAPAPSPVPLPPPPSPPAEEPLRYWSPPAEGQPAPTRGSLAHGLGRCKPCAFVHTKGCGNGFECPFCHLCEPGEKKKRRKDKLEARRVSREVSRAFPFGNSVSMGHGKGGIRQLGFESV